MARFILVTGGWHGAWAFEAVSNALSSEGHEVQALTLSGLGDEPAHGTNLERHIGAIARRRDRLRRCLRAGQRCIGLVARHPELSGAFHSGRGCGWSDLRAVGPSRQPMPSPSNGHFPAGDQVIGATSAAKPSSPHAAGKEVRSSNCTNVCDWTLNGRRIASTAHTMFRGWRPKLSRGSSWSTCRQAERSGSRTADRVAR